MTDKTQLELLAGTAPTGESYEEEWLRLGYRVEWSEREPRAYEVRKVGCCPSDNDCLARLPTVQAVAEWVQAHPHGNPYG